MVVLPSRSQVVGKWQPRRNPLSQNARLAMSFPPHPPTRPNQFRRSSGYCPLCDRQSLHYQALYLDSALVDLQLSIAYRERLNERLRVFLLKVMVGDLVMLM